MLTLYEDKSAIRDTKRRASKRKYHIKDLLCINPECKDFSYTKNIEIRWCDTYEDIYEKAIQIREQYYSDKTENNISRKVG